MGGGGGGHEAGGRRGATWAGVGAHGDGGVFDPDGIRDEYYFSDCYDYHL